MRIRVSQGSGSNAKLWAMAYGRGMRRQVAEFDLPPVLMTGIVWAPYEAVGGPMRWPSAVGDLGCSARREYASVDEWVADIKRLWPGVDVEDARDEPLGAI